jgi:hypothetical protein
MVYLNYYAISETIISLFVRIYVATQLRVSILSC